MSARTRLHYTSGGQHETGSPWRRLQNGRQDRNRRQSMRIYIRRNRCGDYWCLGRGWVATRELATVFIGVVEALDTCIANSIKADIILEFRGGQSEVRLSHH